MSFPYANIKSPEDYGTGKGTTVLGRSLIPSEVDGNFLALADVVGAMLGALSPSGFGARYGDATKQWAPVGTVYRQRPGMKSALDIYVGTWVYFGQAGSGYSSLGGVFDRAEGGNALSFGGGNQPQDIQPHSHNISIAISNHDDWSAGLTGGNAAQGYATYTSTSAGGVETRPVNQTLREWICVSAPA